MFQFYTRPTQKAGLWTYIWQTDSLVTPLTAKQIDLNRNRVSLRIRCLWGLRNALFHVAKEEGSDKVLGIAMWLPPRATDKPLTWSEWFWNGIEVWRLWGNQVVMNIKYGRGGLNVKVRIMAPACEGVIDFVSDITSGRSARRKPTRKSGRTRKATTF
jgi:hypothetical protein